MKRSILLLLLFAAFTLAFNVETYARNNKKTVRVMSYNIRNGKGMDGVTDYNRTAAVINSVKPGFAALQEVDSVTRRSAAVDVLAKLAGGTGMHYVYAPAIAFQGGKYGIGLISELKPLSYGYFPLPGREEERVLLVAEFERYVVFCTHLSLTHEDRMASLEIINEKAAKYIKPVFLVGDLNVRPESREIALLSESWTVLNDTLAPTFPAKNPRETIDYILGYTANGHTYTVVHREVVEEPIASDHRPVYVDVKIKKARKR